MLVKSKSSKRDESERNWDDSTIWIADNLTVMEGMNSGIVDLIYLDPPFNSNHNYAAPIGSEAAGAEFKDTWTLQDVDSAWHGFIADKNPALYTLIRATKEIHGDSMQSYLIYMARRLLEMKRLLKPTGSIYLHCDETAGHYLKLAMDCIFGVKNFRNQIVWERASKKAKGSQHRRKTFGKDCDVLFFYSMSSKTSINATKQLTVAELYEKFPFVEKDTGRRYNTNVPIFRQPSMGARPNLCYTYKGVTNPHPSGWRVSKERLIKMDQRGEIVWREGKRPLRKTYSDNYQGALHGSLWADIPGASGKERTGYPTQKPLALLKRIIALSSEQDDLVFDPFCGCGTTMIAAEDLARRWIGIDIAPQAAELIKQRLDKELGVLYRGTVSTAIPKRSQSDLAEHVLFSDVKHRPYNAPENKHKLFGNQDGICNGCGNRFDYQLFVVDHIEPKSKGGSDHLSNLQLLCRICNLDKRVVTRSEILDKKFEKPRQTFVLVESLHVR